MCVCAVLCWPGGYSRKQTLGQFGTAWTLALFAHQFWAHNQDKGTTSDHCLQFHSTDSYNVICCRKVSTISNKFARETERESEAKIKDYKKNLVELDIFTFRCFAISHPKSTTLRMNLWLHSIEKRKWVISVWEAQTTHVEREHFRFAISTRNGLLASIYSPTTNLLRW